MTKSKPQVGIIGGGLTGIVTAYRLTRAGCDVTVLEAGETLGGLAAGFELCGQPIERAYHFLYKTDEYMLALVDELGMNDELTYHDSSVATVYDGVVYPMMTPVDLLKFKPVKFHNRIRAGVSVLYLQQVRSWEKLTQTTALEWLQKWAGKEVTTVIWEPLLRGKFDRYYDKVTMSWLWGRVKQRVESRDNGKGQEKLGYFNGGFANLMNRLVKAASDSGANFTLNAPVEGVVHNPETDKVEVRSNGSTLEFDRVLCTVPSGVFSKIASAGKETDQAYYDKLESIDYLDAVVQVLVTDEEISPYYWHNMNTPDAPFVVFISFTALVGTENFGGKHVYYIGDYVPREHWTMSADESEIEDCWFDELEKIFPSFSRQDVSESHVFRFRDAQHIVDVGFEHKLTPHETPIPGVFLANFSQIYPMDRGTNYAVRDGNDMAEQILADISARPLA